MMTALAALPIITLLICLIVLKLTVTRSGGIALGLALAIAAGFFGITGFGLLTASGKALWLALFVSLIVWFALFLYHLVSDFGAIEVINRNIAAFVRDKFVSFVLLAWLFTGFLQGIAGFGIPPVIVTPILIALGFNPVKSLAAAILGHSWAITFGSMGAAFFVIHGIIPDVVTQGELAFPMWIFNTVTILGTGIGVCFIYDGFKGLRKGLLYVLPVTAVMSLVQFFIVTFFGMYSLGTIITAITGVISMYLLYRLRFRKNQAKPESPAEEGKLTLLQSVLPYLLILLLLLSFQFIPKSIRDSAAVSLSFPQTATTIEPQHIASAEENFNPIRIFVHPAMVLLIAAGAACIIYKRAGIWDSAVFGGAVKKTVKKGFPATLALLAFGHMSLIMTDSGMIPLLAKSAADATGRFYPMMSPYIGVLGSFLTGNNTNSNVMFGMFQYTAANELGLSGAVMSAAQSISGSLGCSIASTLVFMAALATKQPENVPVILKRLIPIVLVVAGVMGAVNFVVLQIL
jgi:lactate permease